MRIITFLFMFFVGSAVAMLDPSRVDYSPVRECLSSVQDKLGSENVLKFIQEESGVTDILERTSLVLNSGNSDIYGSLSNDIGCGIMPYTCEFIFKSNASNRFIAQFMLAGTIIMIFEAKQKGLLLLDALSSILVSAINGESVIQDYFGLDIALLRNKVKIIEQANPNIWQ